MNCHLIIIIIALIIIVIIIIIDSIIVILMCACRMSAALFFLGLPDLNKLCCVVVTLREDDGEELRSRQMRTCR